MEYRVPDIMAMMDDESIRQEMEEYGLIGPGDSHPDVVTVKSAAGYTGDTTELYDIRFEPRLRQFRADNGFDDSPFIDPDLVDHAKRVNNIWISRQVR